LEFDTKISEESNVSLFRVTVSQLRIPHTEQLILLITAIYDKTAWRYNPKYKSLTIGFSGTLTHKTIREGEKIKSGGNKKYCINGEHKHFFGFKFPRRCQLDLR
jgi:hypothetical protein